jgi:putative endonuclease
MTAAWVYILRCSDGSLYTGWSTDVRRRLERHRAGKASRYTASRLPVELELALPAPDRRAAMRAEAQIKALTRREKLALIGACGPFVSDIRHALMCIGRLADTDPMQSNQPSTTASGPGVHDGAERVAMERDEMRRALERISHEMLQRVADSFDMAPPAADRD